MDRVGSLSCSLRADLGQNPRALFLSPFLSTTEQLSADVPIPADLTLVVSAQRFSWWTSLGSQDSPL